MKLLVILFILMQCKCKPAEQDAKQKELIQTMCSILWWIIPDQFEPAN